MKTTITFITRACAFTTAVSFATIVSAQNPSMFKKPTPSPSPAASAAATSKSSTALSAADRTFAMKAAKGGMMEVEMGKMAKQNGQSPDVKKIGEMMIADHTAANAELKTIETARGLALDATPTMHPWKSDKDYLRMMLEDHEKDLAEFQREAQSGTDPELKRFAKKTSAVIRKHLERVKGVKAKLKA